MIRRWFESLSRRDQSALLVLALAIGAWLFIQVVFVELDGGRKRRRFGLRTCGAVTNQANGARNP